MVRRRTLKLIDEDLFQVRARIMDSPRFSDRWCTGWVYIDKLLDERLGLMNYTPLHAKADDIPGENVTLKTEAS